ncbi:hypothetical protein HG531_006659 [Fusarium graminearum]|nr:hypothetical protein HG531_006659 [Fusarium graminearum]
MEIPAKKRLESHGNSVAVNTAHEQTKKTSYSKELVKGSTVNGGDLQNTEDDHVEDHGPLATPLVTSKTEHGGTDRAEEEGEGDGCCDCGFAGIIVERQLLGLDRQGVEVKGISGPGAEADEEEDPVLGRQLSHETDGVLDRVWVPPFGCLFTMFVCDDDALLPDEEISKGLLGCRNDALDHGASGLASHRLLNHSHILVQH